MGRALLFLFLFTVFTVGLACAVYGHFIVERGGTVILGWQVPVWVEYTISFLVIETVFPLTVMSGAMFLHHASDGRIISDPMLLRMENTFWGKWYFWSIILAPPLLVLLAWGLIEAWFI